MPSDFNYQLSSCDMQAIPGWQMARSQNGMCYYSMSGQRRLAEWVAAELIADLSFPDHRGRAPLRTCLAGPGEKPATTYLPGAPRHPDPPAHRQPLAVSDAQLFSVQPSSFCSPSMYKVT